MNKPSKRSLLTPSLMRKALGIGVFIGLLAAAGYLTFILVKPMGLGASSALEMRKLERQVEAKRQEKDAKEKEIAALKSQQGSIDAARSIGLTKPDEHIVIIHQEGVGQTGAADQQPADKAKDDRALAIMIGVPACLILLGGMLIVLKRRRGRNRREAGMLTPRSELRLRTRGRPGVEVLD